jgi:hypothetical protein
MSVIPEFSQEGVVEALYQLDNHGTDPERPFTGQAHTDQGERGKTKVDLRFRDVADCILLGFLLSCEGYQGLAESGTATYNDVYDALNSDPSFDPIAVIQNACCEMERRMGIFPNLPDEEDPVIKLIKGEEQSP